ncbi:phospho-beta-glycosidase [Ligilactobacillus salitolerans]|uniref:Phospho-beta-glycosidase n=1 Tax=Ligilactobacillus salitolerans TaxID=1808352 RepID=A0A401IUQ5_9LACO|nr:lysophospholipid acyltransferase family protein [Ligilactobacillus salitolerans]GBG95262.1 phospho-beta-glycosidase [Ligilactobacillus salitolerans]
MIIGGDKTAVVANIEQAAKHRRLNDKVEVADPTLAPEEEERLLNDFLSRRNDPKYLAKNQLARRGIDLATQVLNRQTKVSGAQNITGVVGGAIVTSNHFNPLENTAVRYALKQVNKKRLFVVSQPTNFKMTGWVGFFLKYADTIPISRGLHYMRKTFPLLLKDILAANNYVLIYPEQEMWFNYCKPRPLKRGTYYYAARLNVPVISCFVEMQATNKDDNEQFKEVIYTVHILKPIYPDPNKSIDENSRIMLATDYQQKKAAYEAAYHTQLNYDFKAEDIVGWNHE